jgi:hypothetical protein
MMVCSIRDFHPWAWSRLRATLRSISASGRRTASAAFAAAIPTPRIRLFVFVVIPLVSDPPQQFQFGV